MSLLDAILNKKARLKQNETRVTTVSGYVFKEHKTSTGEQVRVEISNTAPGYVIDEAPDLQVAFVLPWLCMGSQDVVSDQLLLKQNKISCVLSLGVTPPVKLPHIEYFHLPVYDEPGYNLSQHFTQCFSYIDRCHDNHSIIYVHCNAGVSRSATLVLAYVMKRHSLGLTQAIDMVKKVRPCIKPNPGFMKQLKDLEEALIKERECRVRD
uniref:Dual specificity protein phosphatase 19 n=2 Tax=Cacopsylla melanoneura TaxID=428564 RepID=A0A8D8VDZ6_9HEMI